MTHAAHALRASPSGHPRDHWSRLSPGAREIILAEASAVGIQPVKYLRLVLADTAPEERAAALTPDPKENAHDPQAPR